MSNAALKQEPEEKQYTSVNYSHPLESVFKDVSYFIEQPLIQIMEESYKIKGNTLEETYSAVRKRQWMKQFFARFCGFIGFAACFGAGIFMAVQMGKDSSFAPFLIFGGFAVGIVVAMFISKFLSPIRLTHLYQGEDREQKPLLSVEPTSGHFYFNREYKLVDAEGKHVVTYKRPWLESIFRIRWHCHSPEGEYLFTAVEDSLVLAILRRYLNLGKFIPMTFELNKNGGKMFAQFKRRFSIRDKYNLEHNPKAVASWIIIATALLLDTGELR